MLEYEIVVMNNLSICFSMSLITLLILCPIIQFSTALVVYRDQIENSNLDSLAAQANSRKEENGPVNAVEYDSLDDVHYIDEDVETHLGSRKKKNVKQWDHWVSQLLTVQSCMFFYGFFKGKWSDCSVSCGVGKSVRWRHCVSNGCADGEKEAQIRTCTMKPCT